MLKWPSHVGKSWRQRIAVLQAGLHDFAGKALCVDGFHHTAPFRYKAGNIGAGSHITALLQRLKVQPNGHLIHFGIAGLAEGLLAP